MKHSEDLAPLTSLLVEGIKDVCDCEAASLLKALPNGGLEFACVVGGAAESVQSMNLAPGEGIAGRVLITGSAEIVSGTQSNVARQIQSTSGFQMRSMIAIPLEDEKGKVGVAEALNPRDGPSFHEGHLERFLEISLPLARALRAMSDLEAPGAMESFYDALSEVLSLRTAHFKTRSERLEASRRSFEIHRARRYGDEKMAGLARMAAGISHEINNPLAVVIANTNLLGEMATDIQDALTSAREALAAGDAQAAQKALAAADIDTLLEDIVDVASEGKTQLDRIAKVTSQLMLFGDRNLHQLEEVNLAEEAERVSGLVRLGALGHHENRVQLEVESMSKSSIKACRTHIRQMFLELLENALRAADQSQDPKGGVVKMLVFSDSEKIHITVEDNGPGIEFEQQHRVFDPFYTSKANWRSTGLGLTAVYGVVRALGGLIAVDSVPGRGAQFTVSLPLHQPQEETPDSVENSETSGPIRTGRYYEDLR